MAFGLCVHASYASKSVNAIQIVRAMQNAFVTYNPLSMRVRLCSRSACPWTVGLAHAQCRGRYGQLKTHKHDSTHLLVGIISTDKKCYQMQKPSSGEAGCLDAGCFRIRSGNACSCLLYIVLRRIRTFSPPRKRFIGLKGIAREFSDKPSEKTKTL